MDFNNFLEKFNSHLLEDNINNMNEETKYRELGSWDSLSGMAIIVMIEEDYGVKLTNDTFRSFVTIADIVNYIELSSEETK